MCGIAGYAGPGPAEHFLSAALRRLEYRGYDSWGMAGFRGDGAVEVVRGVGAPSARAETLTGEARVGVGHTRWATHGKVCVGNAHPVEGGRPCARAYVVHNGVVDNHAELKAGLQADGFDYRTETDTETVAHVLAAEASSAFDPVGLRDAVLRACRRLEGEYAFAALVAGFPDLLVCATTGPPLLVTPQGYVASDPAAFSGYCQTAYRLRPGQVAVVRNDRAAARAVLWVSDGDDNLVWERGGLEAVPVPSAGEADRAGHPHFMLKEIHEQPGWLGRPWEPDALPQGDQLVLFGCGSSYNAALLGRKYLEGVARVPARVEYATELAAADLLPAGAGYVALTQSGETKDTVAALRRVAGLGPCTVLTNNGASAAAALGRVVPLDCGPEYGVAATKTFTAQAARLYQLARAMSAAPGDARADLSRVGCAINTVLSDPQVRAVARFVSRWHNILYLGRGPMYPVAREGALKMMEVAYRHAHAMVASEMKHGPIALVDGCVLSVVLLGSGDAGHAAAIRANVEELKARGGVVVAVADESVAGHLPPCDRVLRVPQVGPLLQPLVVNAALQLIAYHCAALDGLDVDRPRNLAKSVTV